MSIKTTSVLFFLCALCAPLFVSADVFVNEFLYDAPGTDTDQEYIELLNTGSAAVDLTKWKINDGSPHTLNAPPIKGGTGSIIIAPGEYALLVDNAANFLAAHAGTVGTVIDTVLSLSNISATISLTDDSGTTVSTVSYTKDQGANGTGNSLQKNGDNWIEAAATPNAANATVTAPRTDESGETDTATSTDTIPAQKTTAAPVSSYVPPPVPTIFADAGNDRTVIVGADTEFDGRAYDRDDEDVDHVRFSWNFGDGSTAEGPSVLHHYSYPGRYATVLSIAQNKTAVIDQFIVTAEPAHLAFVANPDGSASIKNEAGRDLDLSGWIMKSFARIFILPEHSILLSNATLRIPHETLGFFSGLETELDYPNGALALKQNKNISQDPVAAVSVSAISSAPAASAQAVPTAPSISAQRSQPIAQDRPGQAAAKNTVPAASSSVKKATTSQVAAAATTVGGRWYWWMALALAALALGAMVLFVQNMKAGEWDIVEETPDRE